MPYGEGAYGVEEGADRSCVPLCSPEEYEGYGSYDPYSREGMSPFGPAQQEYGAYGGGLPGAEAALRVTRGSLAKPHLFVKRKMNIVAILIALFLPWGLFAVTNCAMLYLHYDSPGKYHTIMVCGVLIVLILGVLSFNNWRKKCTAAVIDPTWLVFIFVTAALAWIVAYVLGGENYATHIRPFFDFENLNTYSGVFPTRMRGQQIQDAGRINFAVGSALDLQKSMGFRSTDTYCVAPITMRGAGTLPTYDFWAVGKNCCSGVTNDFHCDDFNVPGARGGLRVLDDSAIRMQALGRVWRSTLAWIVID